MTHILKQSPCRQLGPHGKLAMFKPAPIFGDAAGRSPLFRSSPGKTVGTAGLAKSKLFKSS